MPELSRRVLPGRMDICQIGNLLADGIKETCIELDSGSGSFSPGGSFELVSGERNGDSVWETKNYENSNFQIEMGIDQGSGSISFR